MTFNEHYENNFLAKLRTLPEPIFRECVYRLQDGEPAISVTRWLLTVPNRGGMQRVDKLPTLRRYLEILGRQVLRLKVNAPPSAVTSNELKQIVEQERRRVGNEIAIAGGRPNSQFESIIESMINDHAKATDRRLWLQATAVMNLERMRLAHCLEQRLKTPILEATKISQVIIHAAEADARAELADLNIRKAKQDVENEDLYGAINCAGELVKGQPAAVNSGPAPAAESAVGEPKYLVLPPEFIEAYINASPGERMTAAAAINLALTWMYSADVWRKMEEEEAQLMRPTAAGNNVEDGTLKESPGAAAKACATQTSPEEPQEADTIASGGEGLRWLEEELAGFVRVHIRSSVADRRAICDVLEVMLMITEAENVFRKQPQAAGDECVPAEQSAAGAMRPRANYRTSAENFELLQVMISGCERFSPVAHMMWKRVLEIATKAVEQDLIARGALA